MSDPLNPYAPPRDPRNDEEPRPNERPERMPGSVIAAAVLVGLIGVNFLVGAALSTGGGEARQPFLPIAITLAVLMGIFLRHPTAWSASRSLAALGAFLLGLAVVAGTLIGDGGAFLSFVLPLAPILGINIAIYILMSRPTARAWFGVTCPRCGNLHTESAKFGFRLARCRECAALWDPQTGLLRGE